MHFAIVVILKLVGEFVDATTLAKIEKGAQKVAVIFTYVGVITDHNSQRRLANPYVTSNSKTLSRSKKVLSQTPQSLITTCSQIEVKCVHHFRTYYTKLNFIIFSISFQFAFRLLYLLCTLKNFLFLLDAWLIDHLHSLQSLIAGRQHIILTWVVGGRRIHWHSSLQFRLMRLLLVIYRQVGWVMWSWLTCLPPLLKSILHRRVLWLRDYLVDVAFIPCNWQLLLRCCRFLILRLLLINGLLKLRFVILALPVLLRVLVLLMLLLVLHSWITIIQIVVAIVYRFGILLHHFFD